MRPCAPCHRWSISIPPRLRASAIRCWTIPLFRRFFGDRLDEQDDKQFSLGSGVIVSTQGYILTNNHVIEAADEIEVALADGRKAVGKVVGTDAETDLAVIKINLPDLPAIILGRVEQSKVGDVVLAIGNPFGVGQTVTMGIVSALGRSHLGINTFENFIQTDAAINPGNSGGALIDTNGNLLGINTAIYSRSGGSLGIGFAIPVSTVKTVMDSIISTGQVVRGWIGVEPQDITPELAESFGLEQKSGAIIAGVLRDGPADRAGMRPGDILIAVNGKNVKDTTDMLNLIAQLQPGKSARMTILRKNAAGRPGRGDRHAAGAAARRPGIMRRRERRAMHVRDLTRFLAELAENNNRAWFVMNKPRYDILRAEFLELVTQLIADIARFDPAVAACNPKKALFRINKDMRFSRDKTPLQDAFCRIDYRQRSEKTKPGRRPGVLLSHRCGWHAAGGWRRIPAAGESLAGDPPASDRRCRRLRQAAEEPQADPGIWRPAGRRQAVASAERFRCRTVRTSNSSS